MVRRDAPVLLELIHASLHHVAPNTRPSGVGV